MVPNCVPAGSKKNERGWINKMVQTKMGRHRIKKTRRWFQRMWKEICEWFKKAYPKCVPAAKAAAMSESQRRSAVARKRAAGNVGSKTNKR